MNRSLHVAPRSSSSSRLSSSSSVVVNVVVDYVFYQVEERACESERTANKLQRDVDKLQGTISVIACSKYRHNIGQMMSQKYRSANSLLQFIYAQVCCNA